ncbi:MAG: MerR family transcriptional regulator [Acidobacteriota bacterium]
MSDYYKPLYSIGKVAKILNVSVQTLRLYENNGFIIPYKTSSKRRIYSELEIDKIRCIIKMIREEGMNFKGLKKLYSLIPCWYIRECSKEEREKCNSFISRSLPCWATREKCPNPLPDCRECPVYRKFASRSDLKDSLNDLMK